MSTSSRVLHTGNNSVARVGPCLYVCPFSVSWLVWSEVGGLWGAGTVLGGRVVRLAHMS